MLKKQRENFNISIYATSKILFSFYYMREKWILAENIWFLRAEYLFKWIKIQFRSRSESAYITTLIISACQFIIYKINDFEYLKRWNFNLNTKRVH